MRWNLLQRILGWMGMLVLFVNFLIPPFKTYSRGPQGYDLLVNIVLRPFGKIDIAQLLIQTGMIVLFFSLLVLLVGVKGKRQE